MPQKTAAGGKDLAAAEAYLACGSIALDSGDQAAAAEIFKTLADAKYPAPVRRAALTGQLLLADDLVRVGGKVVLERIDKAIASENQDVRAAGIRALCNWPDASVADRLAKLAKDQKEKGVRTAALRAYNRVVSLKSDRPEEETLSMLIEAFQAAERPEEMILVTERAGAVRHMQTLRWLVALLENDVVAQQACRSIVELAHHRYLRNPNRKEFSEALKRVIAISKDRATVDRGKRYLEGV